MPDLLYEMGSRETAKEHPGVAIMRVFAPSRRVFLGVVLFLASGCGSQPKSELSPEVKHLLEVMGTRLALMHEVSRTKWSAGLEIADPKREQALLLALEQKGQQHGLDAEVTRAFFAAQIAAARQLQEADFRYWPTVAPRPFTDTQDLTTLRERIDDLNQELLVTLAKVRPQLGNADIAQQIPTWARKYISAERITDDIRATALEGLTQR
jgi:chorismate mutase-like protein